MKNSRIEQLKTFLQDEPEDPFLLYALAMEYDNSSQNNLAKSSYLYLLEKHEDYLGTYYISGKFFQKTGETEKAKDVFNKGIVKANHVGNVKAASELRNALNELLYEEEED